MSTNLHAKAGNNEIELWQTPSWITWMICVRGNGHVAGDLYDDEHREPPLTGDEAKRALRAYLIWTSENLDEMAEGLEFKELQEHRQAIRWLIDNGCDLSVWAA